MPRKSPTHYPESFWRIVEVTIREGEFSIECQDKYQARSLRATFYSYAKSLLEANGKEYSKEQLEKWHQQGSLAAKIMITQTDNVLHFRDKAKFGHANAINEALKKKGLDWMIPPESLPS